MTVEYIDLLGLLKVFKSKGIEKSKLYGRILRKVDKPSNLQEDIVLGVDGAFVEMEVFAVNLKYHDSYLRGCGLKNKDSIYMVNGNVIAYVDATNIDLSNPDWFTISGTIRFGSKQASPTYVCVFNFYKTKEGKWGINPCKVEDLDISDWDRHSQCYYWITESCRVSELKHPDYVLSLPRFSSFIADKFIPLSNSDNKSDNIDSHSTNLSYFKKENRLDIKNYNDNVEKFKVSLLNSKSNRETYISNLKIKYGYDAIEQDYLEYMLKGLVKNLRNKVNNNSLTGRVIIRKYLSNFRGSNDRYGGTRAGIYLSNIFDEIAEYIRDNNNSVSADGIAWDLCKSAFGDIELFYAGVVSVILGISFDIIEQIVYTCEKYDLSIIRIFNENPYVLQFVSSLRFNEIERIALCFNKHSDKSLDDYRNVVMLNSYIEDNSRGSTVFTKDMIISSDIGITLTKTKYETMKLEGTYLSYSLRSNIQEYLLDISSANLGYVDKFKKRGYNYIKVITPSELLEIIKEYEKTGLGVVSNNFVTSSSLMEKELYVFEKMYELGSRVCDYDDTLIDKYIDEYELLVGFRLEKMQRYAVHLITRAGFIVTGGAGSGKTTVSNCIVYVLNKLDPSLDIEFAAPTGKAAKRMQEVVHSEVKTLHSKFKLGLKKEYTIDNDDNDIKDFGRVAFLFDEGAMITIDLLYKVLRKIDISTSRVILFGDFNQLPPIGKGLPFKNLLRFMPCVFLNVSKRAEAGSNITANSNYINEYSNLGNWKRLESGKDFFLLPCKGNQIQRVVRDLCAYYLGKLTDDKLDYIKAYLGVDSLPTLSNIIQDDIQVVSPLAKPNYSWGTTQLNKVLEPLFNSIKGVDNTFVYKLSNNVEGNVFSIGDRVIHVDRNMYSMQWYSSYKDGAFQKIYGCGICNGEVGKIVDFIKADSCDFYDEVEDKPSDFEYYDSLRDDSTWVGDDKWFVVVEYYDYISDRDFYILYRAEINEKVEENRGIALKGDDLSRLNLFYAGTTHKLQGSQCKIVICVLDDVNYKGFITRQMLYTMVTRGEKLVYLVGSVGNDQSSMLSRARLDVASSDILTVGELII